MRGRGHAACSHAGPRSSPPARIRRSRFSARSGLDSLCAARFGQSHGCGPWYGFGLCYEFGWWHLFLGCGQRDRWAGQGRGRVRRERKGGLTLDQQGRRHCGAHDPMARAGLVIRRRIGAPWPPAPEDPSELDAVGIRPHRAVGCDDRTAEPSPQGRRKVDPRQGRWERFPE